MGSQTDLKRKLLIKAVGRQRGKCHICGEQMASHLKLDNPLRATADHKIPKSLGGPISGNIAAAHAICNEKRGNRNII